MTATNDHSGAGLALVVAVDSESGIGKDGTIPWRVPADMRHFKNLTRTTQRPDGRNAVIMGRATWASIPARFRPLAGRVNIVLSRQSSLDLPAGVLLAGDFPDAITKALAAGVERIFVIGGAQVYRRALARDDCCDIFLTTLDRSFACDTHLPPVPGDFALAEQLGRGESGGVGYRIERWHRDPKVQKTAERIRS